MARSTARARVDLYGYVVCKRSTAATPNLTGVSSYTLEAPKSMRAQRGTGVALRVFMKRKKRARARNQKQMFSTPCACGTCAERGMFGWIRHAPMGPDERVWIEQAIELAIRFGAELSDDFECQMIDLVVVTRAAECLWATSPGSPHWRDLDVEEFLSLLDRVRLGDLRDNAIASLIGLTHFLSKHGYITDNEALVLRSRLDPYASPLMVAMGYEPVVLPAHLRPS